MAKVDLTGQVFGRLTEEKYFKEYNYKGDD